LFLSHVFCPGFFQIITSEQIIGALGQEFCIKISMTGTDNNLFEESYRVVAVEAERLIIKGTITGTVLTIVNSDPGTPLTAEEYPLGKLVVLSDPSASAPN
jgi:hypothetical protein